MRAALYPAEPPPRLPALKGRCAPESAQRLRKAIEHAFAGSGTLDVEIEIITFRDSRLWVRVIGHMERLNGRPSRVYGSVQDIQAQKVSQIALENSTAWLKLSMNMAHLHAWLGVSPIDIDTTRLQLGNQESDSHYRMKYPHTQSHRIAPPQRHELSPRIQAQIETAYAWFYQTYYPRKADPQKP